MSDETETGGGGIEPSDAEGAPADPAPDTGDDTDWKALAAQARADADKWKGLARKHETQARKNADADAKAKTVEQQLDELRGQLTERDTREVERNGVLALAQVHTRLAEAGFKRADVAGLLDQIDPQRLLSEGQPDEQAIGRLAESLTRVAGRAAPDPDQGSKGGKGPVDMNTLIRRAAGIQT